MGLSSTAPATTVQGVLDLDFCAPTPERATTRNPLPPAMAALLAAMGVASVTDRDEVALAVERELAALGLTAEIVGVRHGTLRLRACPQQARFLRYEVARLQEQVDAAAPGVVARIVVEVARSLGGGERGPSTGQA